MDTNLKNHEKIKDAFEKYTKRLDKTSERRELWKNKTKEKIICTLELIQSHFKFDWHVQKLEDIENYQTINISCNSKSSGMIETERDFETGKVTKVKSYIKYGGYLAFGQSYNGMINVFIKYPYIEEWVKEMNVEVLDTIEPSKLSEEVISQFAIQFLNKLSTWEGTDRTPLGFKME